MECPASHDINLRQTTRGKQILVLSLRSSPNIRRNAAGFRSYVYSHVNRRADNLARSVARTGISLMNPSKTNHITLFSQDPEHRTYQLGILRNSRPRSRTFSPSELWHLESRCLPSPSAFISFISRRQIITGTGNVPSIPEDADIARGKTIFLQAWRKIQQSTLTKGTRYPRMEDFLRGATSIQEERISLTCKVTTHIASENLIWFTFRFLHVQLWESNFANFSQKFLKQSMVY